MKKRISLAFIVVALLVLLDQLVKYVIDTRFVVGESHPVIDSVFSITYVQNRGAAWGSLSGKRIFLLAVTFVILCGAVYIYTKLAAQGEKRFQPLRISLVFLIAGAIGNMIDRIVRGFVVDMFDFCLINFPVFNVADIFVTCSFIVIVFLILVKYKDDELEEIIRIKKTE